MKFREIIAKKPLAVVFQVIDKYQEALDPANRHRYAQFKQEWIEKHQTEAMIRQRLLVLASTVEKDDLFQIIYTLKHLKELILKRIEG